MKPGLRPRIVRQIFAPTPAARSRCLAGFVAIARQGLPIPLRYEASTVLVPAAAAMIVVGLLLHSISGLSRFLMLGGWMVGGLAVIALISQHRFDYGHGRSRLIRGLDAARRVNGLDQVILPESLEFLEATSQQWERIEHAMTASVWDEQGDLRDRIRRRAHTTMEDILVAECGSIQEAGLSDEEADRRLTDAAAYLRHLADFVDAAGTALQTYPREDYESSGASASGVVPEIDDLEAMLSHTVGLLPVRS